MFKSEIIDENLKDQEEKNKSSVKVIFKDLLGQITVGNWLRCTSNIGREIPTIATYFSNPKKMQEIPQEELDTIANVFGTILELIGINKEETCILSDFNEKDTSFHMELEKSQKKFMTSLAWGDPVDDCPEITISDGKKSKTYECWDNGNDITFKVQLLKTIMHESEEKMHYKKCIYDSFSTVEYSVQNEEHIVSIIVNGTRDALKDEVKQYLLGLTFPVDIPAIYKKIKELSKMSITEYEQFRILIQQIIEGKRKVITDQITLKNGKLTSIIMTRKNTRIEIGNDKNTVNLTTKNEEVTELIAGYNEAKQQVEQVLRLTQNK